jgi:hypothetical protein
MSTDDRPNDFTDEDLRELFRRGLPLESDRFVRPEARTILAFAAGKTSAEDSARIYEAMALSTGFRAEIMTLLEEVQTQENADLQQEMAAVEVPQALLYRASRMGARNNETARSSAGNQRVVARRAEPAWWKRWLWTPQTAYAITALSLIAVGLESLMLTTKGPPGGLTAQFGLLPDILRGELPPMTLILDPSVSTVEIIVDRELSPQPQLRYEVTVSSFYGKEIYQSSRPDVVLRDGKRYATVRLAAEKVPPGDYDVSITVRENDRLLRTEKASFRIERASQTAAPGSH